MRTKPPFEYQKGLVNFLNYRIDLSKKTFIPRIETEYWVAKAIKEVKRSKAKGQGVKILDIFAGSGCIGIALLKNIKGTIVHFADIEKKAVEQIKINLKLNKIPKERYRISRSDLFKKLKENKYNFIFANPPYIAIERLRQVDPEVLEYEPQKALLAGPKGIYYIKQFLKGARDFLTENGIIYMELDPRQKKEIERILRDCQYKHFKFFKDQFKKYRYVKVKK